MLAHKLQISWPNQTKLLYHVLTQKYPQGIFSTGIENSDPTVNGKRIDELTDGDNFRKFYRSRLKQIHELGIRLIRFGDGYAHVGAKKNHYDFHLTDQVIQECQELNIEVIADLLHFGIPDWLHRNNPHHPYFQNPLFPHYFAQYAKNFAHRYPSVHFFNPINEPFVTAKFSALYGMWNEHEQSEEAFCRAVVNIAKAEILARKAIWNVWEKEKREGEPIFFQNESFEKCFEGHHGSTQEVAKINHVLRFAALDLMFGHHDQKVKEYLLEKGIKEVEYEWCMKHGNTKNVVLGIDFYPTCVQKLEHHKTCLNHDSHSSLFVEVAKEYWYRYKLLMYHMEINGSPKVARVYCHHTFTAIQRLKEEGYPILSGMTWFGDNNFCGWDSCLFCKHLNPVGLYNHNHKRRIASYFQRLSLAFTT